MDVDSEMEMWVKADESLKLLNGRCTHAIRGLALAGNKRGSCLGLRLDWP